MARLRIVTTDRPDPKSYFGPADKGFLNWDTLIWRFAGEKSYWLSTVAQNEHRTTPHSMPVWGVWYDDAFWFSTAPYSKKAQNLRLNPHANVHLDSTEAVAILECDAVEISGREQLQQFVNEYNPKYKWNFSPDDVSGGVFALTPHTAFAWAAGEGSGFHDTATRWQFETVE